MLSSNSPSGSSSSLNSTSSSSFGSSSSTSPKRRNAPPPLNLQANQHRSRPSLNSPLKQSYTPTSARTCNTTSSASSPSTPGFASSATTSASSSSFSSSIKDLASGGHQSTPSSSGFKFWKKRSGSGTNVQSGQSSPVTHPKSASDPSRQQQQRDQHQHQPSRPASDSPSLPHDPSSSSSHRIQRKPNSVQTYPFDLRASSSEDPLPSRRSGAFFDKSYHWTQAEGPMPPFPDGFSSMRDLRSASSSQLDLTSESSSMKEGERRFVSTRRTGGSVESPALAFGKGWGEDPMRNGSPSVARNRPRGHERKRSNSMSNLPASLPSQECLISQDMHPQPRRSSASSSFPSRRPSSAQHRVLHSAFDQTSATSSKMTSTRRKPSSVTRPAFTSLQASPQSLNGETDNWCRMTPTEPIEPLGPSALPTFIVVPATPDLGSDPSETEELDSELVTDEQNRQKRLEEEEEASTSEGCQTPTNASGVSFNQAASPPTSSSLTSSSPPLASSTAAPHIKPERTPLLLDLSADDLGFNFASSFSFDSSFSFSGLESSPSLASVASSPSLTGESSSSNTPSSPVNSSTESPVSEPAALISSPTTPPARPARSVPSITTSALAEVALPDLVSSTSCFSTSSGFTSDEVESPRWEHPELQVNVIPEEDIDEVDDQLDRLLASLSVDNLQTPKASPNLSESTSVASLASILASSPTAFDHFPLPPSRLARATPPTSFSAPMLTGQSGLGLGIEASDTLNLEPKGRLASPMLVRDHRKPFYLRQERSYSDRTGLNQSDVREPLKPSISFNQDNQVTIDPSTNQPSKFKTSASIPSLPSAGSVDSNLSLYSTDIDDEDGEDSTSCQHGDLESVEIREMERVDFRVVFARSTKSVANENSENKAVAL